MLADLRDVAIVILAIESIIIGITLILTLLQLRSLARLIRDEIAPMLDTANETATIVKGTTDFVSESVVQPVIRVASYGAAARRAALVVFRRRHSA